jgi:2-polyprenyl-6-methoxyphenol hydroxylase-like FAD-dependent oxidoreductase
MICEMASNLKTDDSSVMRKTQLDGLKIIVIGAGPGGLTFAKGAHNHGAQVEVIERAGDPRGEDAGYTDRSFNLTLNNVGRTVLGDERTWKGATMLEGRAIHKYGQDDETQYASYGEGDSAILTSVPRPVLRQNMTTLTEELGINIRFRTEVVNIKPDEGEIEVCSGDTSEVLSADLIVVADGVHSIGDSFIEKMGGNLNRRAEPLKYVNVMLSKESCQGMSLHHIHFWNKPDSGAVAIGLPNADGTIAALLVSKFDDIDSAQSPFETIESATNRLERNFPQLLALQPDLPQQLLGRKRASFYYKSISSYILGKKCVMVGDAGSASPPWAGFGANTAIYSADALVRFMVGFSGDLDSALKGYQEHKLTLAKYVLGYADEHGEFLNKKVTKNPEQRPIGPVLAQIVNKTLAETPPPENVDLLRF